MGLTALCIFFSADELPGAKRMYLEHWGLERPPFPGGLSASSFYEGTSQREALARLRYVLANKRRLGLVLGGTGLGKSLLLRLFAHQCRKVGHATAELDLQGITSRELFWQLGVELHAAVRVEDDSIRLFRQLCDRLQEIAWQGKQAVVLLDNLDQAGPDLQSQLLRLTRTETASSGQVSFIASGNPAQLQRVSKGLLEQVELRIDLHPWDELDTTGYLQTSLVEAGAVQPLFDDGAMSALFRQSSGNPRLVTRLADYALLEGSRRRQPIVDAELIRTAAEATTLPSAIVSC